MKDEEVNLRRLKSLTHYVERGKSSGERESGEGVIFVLRGKTRGEENTYIDGCRCNSERLNPKTEGSNRLVYTGFRG